MDAGNPPPTYVINTGLEEERNVKLESDTR